MWSVFENIHPPAILTAGGHVIGYNIQKQAHAALLQFTLKRCEPFFASEIGVDSRGIGAVVTVGAAAAAGENRRRVNIGNSQLLQIVEDVAGVCKRKIAVKLQTI